MAWHDGDVVPEDAAERRVRRWRAGQGVGLSRHIPVCFVAQIFHGHLDGYINAWTYHEKALPSKPDSA